LFATIYHTLGDPSYFKEGFNHLQNLNSSVKGSSNMFFINILLKGDFFGKFTICYEAHSQIVESAYHHQSTCGTNLQKYQQNKSPKTGHIQRTGSHTHLLEQKNKTVQLFKEEDLSLSSTTKQFFS
jgi:hypothetical protein